MTNYVFMNAQGEYLRFGRQEKRGFASGSHWVADWVADLHSASVSNNIPRGHGIEWSNKVGPFSDVVATIPASVVSHRVVTLEIVTQSAPLPSIESKVLSAEVGDS